MAERVTVVRLRAEIADLKRQMKDAGLAVEEVADKAEKSSKRSTDALNKLATGAGLLGAAMLAAATTAVMAFANFDQEMSAVQAATRETSKNMDLLRSAALEAGKATVFTATEAASAEESLGKAGLSTSDILRGGLTGALNLASAGSMEVASAADIMATSLSQFNLTGDKASHVADLLAAGAGKAQGDVSDMAMALKQSGTVAHQFGLSVDQTVGTLTAFAKAGLIGSDAGTSFRTMLLHLANPSQESADLMRKLGINAYDAGGKFVGMASLAQQLNDRLGGLTQATRDQALAQIFGMDAIRGANVLMKQGADGIIKWTQAVNDQGYASEQARIKLDNLKGDWEQLTGSVETALIGVGKSADGPLRSIVRGATDLVNAFAGAPDVVQGTTLAIVGGGGLVLLGIAGIAKLIVAFNEAKAAAAALGITAKGAGIAAGAIGGALTIATLAIAAWADGAARAEARSTALRESLDETTGAVTHLTRATIANDLQTRQGWWLFKENSAADQAKKLGLSLETLTSAVVGNKDAIAQVDKATQAYTIGSAELDAQMKATGMSAYDLGSAKMVVRDQVAALSSSLTDEQKKQMEAAKATGESTQAAQEQKSALGQLADDMAAGQATTEAYTDALKDLIDAQRQAAGIALSERDAQRNLQAAIDDAAKARKDNGDTLDIDTEKGRANQAALDDIAKTTWDVIDAMRQNGETQGAMEQQMSTSRQAFLDAAGAMGMSADEANTLADKLNLIPSKVSAQVLVDTAQAENSINRLIRLFNGTTITMNVQTGSFRVNGTSVKGFAGGGWTGDGPTHQAVGPVHGQEFVVKAGPAAQYRGALEAINAGQPLRGVAVAAAGSGSGSSSSASFVGLEISGTLNTPWGPSEIRGVVQNELSGVAQQIPQQQRLRRGVSR